MPVPYDQAHVRRDGSVWRRLGGLTLCEVCGVQHRCDLTQALETLAGQKTARVVIGQCAGFLPVLSFQDFTGLEGRFNTFRRGQGWANRVTPSGRVALFDLTGRALLGVARIEGVHVGPLGELLGEHAAMNHLMKARPEQEAPELLHRVLRRLYGNTYAAASEMFSVLSLSMEEDGCT
jgi:hypothetical protein